MENQNMTKLFTKVENGDIASAEKKSAIELGKRFKYLILIQGEYKSDNEGQYKTFEIIQGRQAAYDYIKDMLRAQDDLDVEYIIDVSESHIIAEPPAELADKVVPITLSNMISIYSFMVAMRRDGMIVDDDESFNIDNYFDGYTENEVESDDE